VNETCQAICKELKVIVMPNPSAESWTVTEHGFQKWNFQNYTGAIAEKHAMIQAPGCSRSLYFNYKKYLSNVLLALVDTNYKFIAVNVGVCLFVGLKAHQLPGLCAPTY
jgi:hypothetical protein